MGVDGCWCAPWSSKLMRVVNSCLGGFDSHMLPPKIMRPWTAPGALCDKIGCIIGEFIVS